MGRFGIYDIGYEDFGFPGGGNPQERMDLGLSGVVGAAGAMAPQDVVTGDPRGSLAGASYIPKGTNLALFKPIRYGQNDSRIPTLVRRLQIVGIRKDPRVPMVFDDLLSADVLAFQARSGLPYTPDGEVDATTWYKLNQTAYLVGRGEMKPLGVISGPQQTFVAKKEKQPTDNALNAEAASTTSGARGTRLLVKTPVGNGDSSDTGSAAKHNEGVNRELSRKTKRDISSLPGLVSTPFRPGGVAHKKTVGKDGKVAMKAGLGGVGLVGIILILILIFRPEWLGL
jgi:hypothetical protein